MVGKRVLQGQVWDTLGCELGDKSMIPENSTLFSISPLGKKIHLNIRENSMRPHGLSRRLHKECAWIMDFKLRSNDLSLREFRLRFSLFPVVGTRRNYVARRLVSGSVVSRVVVVNSSRIKGPDGAIASVHSSTDEIFAKPRAVGKARLIEFHRPQSTNVNLERLQIWPSHTPLE
ncbi:hypothetical protein AVEN_149229-1 [Araneus ventricosus]|uniref:Uncharacterized protein n=1 Tax=Araneus ventricosus TaxID=182803 RepID=A0A4Y2SQJ3_ARAVE|nr:hypothetical protein AVEN_149229-1 [Araneus ventricosus]